MKTLENCKNPAEVLPLDEYLKYIEKLSTDSVVTGETKSAPGYHKTETSEYKKNNG